MAREQSIAVLIEPSNVSDSTHSRSALFCCILLDTDRHPQRLFTITMTQMLDPSLDVVMAEGAETVQHVLKRILQTQVSLQFATHIPSQLEVNLVALSHVHLG